MATGRINQIAEFGEVSKEGPESDRRHVFPKAIVCFKRLGGRQTTDGISLSGKKLTSFGEREKTSHGE